MTLLQSVISARFWKFVFVLFWLNLIKYFYKNQALLKQIRHQTCQLLCFLAHCHFFTPNYILFYSEIYPWRTLPSQKCIAKVQTTLLASYPLFLFCLKLMLWKILLLSVFVSVVVASLVRQNACSFALLFVANLGCNILKKTNFYMFLWIVFNYYPIMWLLCFVLNKYYLNKPDAKFVCNVVVYLSLSLLCFCFLFLHHKSFGFITTKKNI